MDKTTRVRMIEGHQSIKMLRNSQKTAFLVQLKRVTSNEVAGRRYHPCHIIFIDEG
jgi:hypothetical protein